ncbi:recombinase family protein [Pseudomonas sp. PLMAX]|uniref:recombinase family protein n=1 Tax=Pseudomonas sp. PLMAX TaxID=2201998 RepID=UPI0038B6F9F9
MPVAVPYIRFSSEQQRHGSSLERQEALVEKWLAHNPDYTRFEQRFEDLGLSGFHGDFVTQGAMGRLLFAIEEGHIPADSVVLVEAMDRFSRLEPMQTLKNLESIVKTGIQLVTLEDGQRYDAQSLKNQSLMYLAMKAQVAHEFSQRLSNFATGSYVDRAKEAKRGGTIKRRNPFWLTSEGKLRDGDSVQVIRQAFLSFANGVPLRLIANRHPEHFKNRQSLKHALKNIAAIGHWQRTKTVRKDGKSHQEPGELIRDVFDAAVTEKLFYQVQKLLADLAEQSPTIARKFSMAGLLQCGECGANMVLLRNTARQQTDVVRCYRRMQSSANCTNQKTIPVPVVYWFYVETRKPHALRAYLRTQLPEAQRLRIKLEGRIDQLRQQQARLRVLVQMDTSDADAAADYQKLVDDRKQLEQELASIPATTVAGTEESPAGVGFYRFMYGDRFAISNLLQLDGYRIICHRDGTLAVNSSGDDSPAATVQYIGYARKVKRWTIEHPDGDIISVDSRGSQ